MPVAVIGAGTMGAGITTACLAANVEVVLVEAAPGRAEPALESIRSSLTRIAKKRRERGESALDVESRIEALRQSVSLEDTVGCAIVIEAIPEVLDLKRSLFSELDALHPPDVVLATNTSSLSIGRIADGLRSPERVVGAHFFNPVPVSALVEVVVGPQTADRVTNAVTSLAVGLGKTPIVVQDSPGFASSRLGLVIGLEAIRMLEAGVASAEDIDTAMELGYRHPMGPLRLTDLVGLDVRLDIARHLESELGDRFSPPQLLIELVENGHLGKKTGRGFYEWS